MAYRKRMKIYRIGWKTAKDLIENEGHRLCTYQDGHAELIEPTREVITYGLHMCELKSREGGCVAGFLTRHSVELLEKNMNPKEQK